MRRELGSAPNPEAASPQECSWGLRLQTPAGAPPQTPLGPKPRSGGKPARELGLSPIRCGPLVPPPPYGYATGSGLQDGAYSYSVLALVLHNFCFNVG